MIRHDVLKYFLKARSECSLSPLNPELLFLGHSGYVTLRNFCVNRMRSPSSFGFQSYQVFICSLDQIRKGINHPFQSDRNYVYMKAFQSD